jgi:hypothetical protein
MDVFHKPPNLFNDDSDSDEGYVPLLEPLEREEVVPVSRYRNFCHVHPQVQDLSSSDSDTDTDFALGPGSDSDSTPSPPLISIDARVTDGVATVGSDGNEILYPSVDEQNSPDDQVCSFNSTQLGYRIRPWIDR